MAAKRTVGKQKEPEVQQGEFGPWTIRTVKSHILESEGADREKFVSTFICMQNYLEVSFMFVSLHILSRQLCW
jgi:hypothetical protein